MMFALALPMLVMVTLGAIDIHQASKVKANLQDALDAAALAAARSKYTDEVNLDRIGLDALKANMPAYFKAGSSDTASFKLQGNTIVADAQVNVKVLVANIVLPPYGKIMDDYLPVGSHSEVLRASRDVEVAMALDITGSMQGQPLIDLKAAANELIDIVVQDQQTPFYSKVALAPYGVGVNLGTYAADARGAIPAPVSITNAQWKTGAAKNIGGITRANPAVFTSNNHGFANGDYVWVRGISGMTQMNNRALEVVNKQTNTFQVRIPGQSSPLSTSSGYNSYSSGGTIQKCLVSDCSAVVTASGHGLSNGEAVWIEEVNGMTQLNKKSWVVGNVTANTFSTGVSAASYGTYTSAGRAWCAQQGCEWYRFDNAAGGVTNYKVSDCASERTGAQAYTDAAPTSGARVGRSYTTSPYASSGNPCPASTIMPLSSSRDDLKAKINALTDDGSTAGQIGLAWGWYLVSPNFSSLWTGASTPAAYSPQKTLKVVILMTDGEFNSPFCQDAIARDAGPSSGGAATHINCDATNGNAFSQAVALCDAMRQQSVIVYTVGFNLNTSTGGPGVDTAIEVLRTCATNENTHFHNANSGTSLKEAFKAIGRDITRLRIAR